MLPMYLYVNRHDPVSSTAFIFAFRVMVQTAMHALQYVQSRVRAHVECLVDVDQIGFSLRRTICVQVWIT